MPANIVQELGIGVVCLVLGSSLGVGKSLELQRAVFRHVASLEQKLVAVGLHNESKRRGRSYLAELNLKERKHADILKNEQSSTEMRQRAAPRPGPAPHPLPPQTLRP